MNTGAGKNSVVDLLVAEGKLQRADLDRALLHNTEDRSLGALLVQMGLVSDQDLLAAYGRLFPLIPLSEDEVPVMPLEDCRLSLKFLREHHILPLAEEAQSITVAVADPEDKFAVRAIEVATGKPVITRLASFSQTDRLLDRLYGEGKSSMAGIVGEIEAQVSSTKTDAIERLKDMAAEAPVVRLVNLIIRHAIELRASDIHIEPFEHKLKLRYRIDGVLQEMESPPARSTAAILSRIKIMARLNIAERRLPQDGRIPIRVQGKLVDLRVSTVPTQHGESLVLRILDKQQLALDLTVLGFGVEDMQAFTRLLALPHGIILVTGPTGSGKTTTLYAALQTLNTPARKILTVEDPVEYVLEGINQIQVRPKIGLHFADALRAIVRQDPDIILIGEMRDLETARIAVQSALTGHLVFSTLHTNDAGSSITRLMEMGVEDYLLTSTLIGILAQRLIRLLCSECREPYTPSPELINKLKLHRLTADRATTLYRPAGCPVCAQTGYHGRTIITELLVLSDSIRHLILNRPDGGIIQQAAIAEGLVPMPVNGFKKALHGLTAPEEVMRVTRA